MTIDVLVIDDGSTDGTVEVARAAGVRHIISLRNRRGLATAFTTGIDAALKLGADFIVNTDGDNQYAGSDIPTLVAPLVSGEADIVIGDRNVETLQHLSWTRKRLQHLGSWVVRQVSNTRVPDTTSGFRAYTREAALRMNIVSDFTYTLESIIQAGKKRMAIAHVPIRSNPKTRPSRLFDNVWVYVKRSASTIVRIYTMYEPFKVFTTIGLVTFAVGTRHFVQVSVFLPQQRRLGSHSVAAARGRADDRGISGAADRAGRRRHFRQPKAPRRFALSRTFDGARRNSRTLELVARGKSVDSRRIGERQAWFPNARTPRRRARRNSFGRNLLGFQSYCKRLEPVFAASQTSP